MSSSTQFRLTPEEVTQYHREGYLITQEPVFSDEEFAGLKALFEKLLEQQIKDGQSPEAMDKPHFIAPELFRWVLSDAVLDLVEPILGPDIHLFSTHFICKPQGDGRKVPWHEDSAYWKRMMEPMNVVTVWLAIDPSTVKNGCMYVVPRSHDNGYSDYEGVDTKENVFHEEIVRPQQRADEAVPIELQPNHASLHDGKMIHGSPPNTSDMRRCGYTMRFVSGDVKLSPDYEDVIGFYPARGEDRAGNKLLDPTKKYPELFGQTRKRVH